MHYLGRKYQGSVKPSRAMDSKNRVSRQQQKVIDKTEKEE